MPAKTVYPDDLVITNPSFHSIVLLRLTSILFIFSYSSSFFLWQIIIPANTFQTTPSFPSHSPCPSPAAPVEEWWSCRLSSTLRGTQCHHCRSLSLSSCLSISGNRKDLYNARITHQYISYIYHKQRLLSAAKYVEGYKSLWRL